ncbi:MULTISPECIES: hypothetical protein [Marinobacter]|uniref:hypothetical protein n=1 Tax=Marinobacter TaxID=2742 RepID=UPI002811CC78|nr:hypothetical protein [Marinobacter sp. F26243]
MSNVIPFPSKNKFSEQFRGKVPDQILDEILAAHDRVSALKDQHPSGEFRVNSEDEEKAQQLFKDYDEYVLSLLTRILSLEAELCLAKYKP